MIPQRTPQEAEEPELKEVKQAYLNSQSSRALFADGLLCHTVRDQSRPWHMQYTCTRSLLQFIVGLLSRRPRLSASLTAKSESNLYPSSRSSPVCTSRPVIVGHCHGVVVDFRRNNCYAKVFANSPDYDNDVLFIRAQASAHI